MASRTLELKLRVKYEHGENPDLIPDLDTCRELLEQLVQTAVNRGYLSGDSDYVVDDWRHEINNL
jgi:hypothetical protein